MTVARRVAGIAAFVAWLYSWYLLRNVRLEYGGGEIGSMPSWLVLLLALNALATLGTAMAAWLRLPAWPVLAIATGLLFVIGIVSGHYAVMSSTLDAFARAGAEVVGKVRISDAVRAALRTRGPLHLVLVTAVPTLLVLSGASGLLRLGPRRAPAPVEEDEREV